MGKEACRDIDALYQELARIAEEEYPHIVKDADILNDRLRLYLIDDSFLDVWFSRRIPCKYAFHWERRHINGSVYRWDNARHSKLRHISTFPHHLHEGSQQNVTPFQPEDTMEDTLRRILDYIIKTLTKGKK